MKISMAGSCTSQHPAGWPHTTTDSVPIHWPWTPYPTFRPLSDPSCPPGPLHKQAITRSPADDAQNAALPRNVHYRHASVCSAPAGNPARCQEDAEQSEGGRGEGACPGAQVGELRSKQAVPALQALLIGVQRTVSRAVERRFLQCIK